MLLNVHSHFSLRYGVLPIAKLVKEIKRNGYTCAVLTDINNSSGVFDFIKACREEGIQGLAGMEFRNGDELLYIGIARNMQGFKELNELMTTSNLNGTRLPASASRFDHAFVIYPWGKKPPGELRSNEFIGVRPKYIGRLRQEHSRFISRCVIWQPVTFLDQQGYKFHKQLRAIDHNLLLSQLKPFQSAEDDECLIHAGKLTETFKAYTQIIGNTKQLLKQCHFEFDFQIKSQKNKQTFTGSKQSDMELLRTEAIAGMKRRYGGRNLEAVARINKELRIIGQQGFAAYFLITWDIIKFTTHKGFYHVGRGSGANSVVAYCLGITDVCPIELDLYFERFLNPKRASPPDFDIDYSWDQRDEVYNYIFGKYPHTALLGAMSTFKDRSIIRELGKIYGLPKPEIDRIIDEPGDIRNKHEIAEMITSVYQGIGQGDEALPNLRTIHASGLLISEEPLTCYSALDLPPKGYPTVQFDMYQAEDIGLEKFDILSQRGIGHIKETAAIVEQNRRVEIDVFDVGRFKKDPKVNLQLKSGDTIGCFYIESPAMRGLLKKLQCSDYLTLVAASSIIRPGVSKSGMMKAYIERFHDPSKIQYLHPVMEDQLKETYGVMVYQEDVIKVGHHFGGLDLADADVLRRMMSGKSRNKKHLLEIEGKYFHHCSTMGYPESLAREVWRQIESFAGYSFSKAHSASYAVESYQSLYLKTYYPLEFMTAVINNFGGFYNTRVYVNEAKKAGASIMLPCVNNGEYKTSIAGTTIHLGFIHVQNLETHYAQRIPQERLIHGPYRDLDDFVRRTGITLDQLIILIRIDAFRFTGKTKKQLLWEAHTVLHKKQRREAVALLFNPATKKFILPQFEESPVEDYYDEMELLGFPVTVPAFDMLRTSFRGEAMTKDLLQHVGKTIRMAGNFVAVKNVRTSRGDTMNFGTFLDANDDFFDTTHFAASLKQYPFKGPGIYLILGRVVEEFGFPSLEVEKMDRLPIKPDPRGV
jgi:DNA-directed DNA polymerase III PolC